MPTNEKNFWFNYVLDNIELVLESLGEQPNRGSYPNELSALGIKEFRRNLYFSAFGEGWGLYSERLADEMGLYSSATDRLGMQNRDCSKW